MTGAQAGKSAARRRQGRGRPGRPAGQRRAGRRTKARPLTRWWPAALVGVASVLLPVGGLWAWATLPGPGSGRTVALEWESVTSAREAASLLHRQGLATSPRLLSAYLWLTSGWQSITPGSHLVTDGASPAELVRTLGRAPSRRRLKVTVPEGWTHLQIADRLEQKGICGVRGFRAAARSRQLMRELGIVGDSVEGYLFPATYELMVNTEPPDVVRLLVAETRSRLARLESAHPGAMARLREQYQWGEREVLTMASIVEKEARRDAERPIIASVYFNRLSDPSFVPSRRLQADPTAAYGCLIAPQEAPSCAGFSGKVTPEMLRDPRNRYNTYRHDGLPPGPIANPGEASLAATLEPAATDYLFFVARQDGRHTFSRTFPEHQRAIDAPR